MIDKTMLVLYVLVGAVAGMIYSLKKIFVLEKKIDAIEKLIVKKMMAKKK